MDVTDSTLAVDRLDEKLEKIRHVPASSGRLRALLYWVRLSRQPGHVVSLLDLTPTFLELADVPVPERYEGQSLTPLLEDRAPEKPRREIFFEFHGHHFPYSQRIIRTSRFKLVVNPADTGELHELAKDPNPLVSCYNDGTPMLPLDMRRETASLARRRKRSGD